MTLALLLAGSFAAVLAAGLIVRHLDTTTPRKDTRR